MSDNMEETVFKYPPMAISFKSGKVKKKPKPPKPPKPTSNSYDDRRKTLDEIGCPSYKDYLKSDLWKQIRRKVFDRKGRKCVRCSEPATEVHHADYTRETMLGISLKRLVPVCRKCHELAEFDKSKAKRTISEANSVLHVANNLDRLLTGKKPHKGRRKGKRKRGKQRTRLAPVGWKRA